MYDFAMITGGSTSRARKAASNCTGNVANANDRPVQGLARYFIDFHKELIRRPAMHGIIEAYGSDANFRALRRARDMTGRTKVLCTDLSHISIKDACDSLGLKAMVLNSDRTTFQVSHEELKRKVRGQESEIAAVVSTFGTTQLGHVERLATMELVQKLRQTGTILHIDAAFGGILAHLSTYAARNMPFADSITIDSHKFIGEGGCAILLTSEPFGIPKISYYTQSPYTMRTTLSAKPLVEWKATLEDCSIAGLRETANMCIYVARATAAELKRLGVPLLLEPELSIVPINLGSKDRALHVFEKLLEKGYEVGKVSVESDSYSVHGVRIVITPKVEPEHQLHPALKLVRLIEQIYHQLSQ